MSAAGISHVELTVGDLERSLAFYRDLLGYEAIQRGISSDLVPSTVKLNVYERAECDFEMAVLRRAGGGPAFIPGAAPLIILLCPVDGPPNGAAIQIDQLGITHLGLWVADLALLESELRERDIEILDGPIELMATPAGSVRSMFVRDPDGIIIQLDQMVDAGEGS